MPCTPLVSVNKKLASLISPTRIATVLAAVLFWMLGSTLVPAAVTTFPSTGKTVVGDTSIAQTVAVTITAGGTLSSAKALTTGSANLDFRISGAASCSSGTPYAVGSICNYPVAFQPTAPGERFGALVLTDAAGNVLGKTLLIGHASGPLALFVPGTISTTAGSITWIYHGDGQSATSSSLFLPFGIAVDSAGNLFIADSNNDRIRRVDASTQLISTVAGNGTIGTAGDGGAATSASLNLPTSIAVDGAGNLYFADSANNAVRRVDASTGIISTVAGTLGVQGYSGDGGQGTAAFLNTPNGIALDGYGNLYIADTANNAVRKLNLDSGVITNFAGNHVAAFVGDGGLATSASLNSPWGVTVSETGDVYVADQNNHSVRKVNSSGVISTIAGNGTSGFAGDGGDGALAILNSPSGVAVDVAGNIYIADTGNNRVRKINAATGLIATVAGDGTETFSGDGGDATSAGMYGPYGLVIDGEGNLYVADVFHNRIRMISSDTAKISYPTMRVNRISATKTETLENDGNAPLNISSLQTVTNAQLDAGTTTCSTATPVASAMSCVIGAQFAPATIGNPVVGSITIGSDSQNSPQAIQLSGQVLTLDPSTAVLKTSASPAALGAPVTFTVTVTSTGVTPTGTATFLDGSVSIGSATLNASGIATLTTASLALGTHSITANYPGDTNNAPSVSNAITQLIKNGTTVLLQSSVNPSSAKSAVVLTATAIGVSGTPTGTITFLDGTTTLGTATLDASGVATFSISTLSVGTHSLKASYAGDASSLANVSSVLPQVVAKSSTTTSLTTSNATSTFSTSVTFTATVVSQTAGVPTGSVTVKDGSTTIGTGTLNASGVATFSTSTLAVSAHSISAVYGGDANNNTSTSSLVSQTVSQIGTSVALTSDSNPSAAGANVLLTATVTAALNPGSDPMTGSVVFTDGTATLGTANITNGVATLNITALSIGQHSIVASYSGATNYAGSNSTTLAQIVQLSPTTGTLTASANPTIGGKPVTLTATVSSSGSMPTGSITFKDGTANVGVSSLNAQGIATFTTSNLVAATHPISAVYAGDTNSQPVTSTLTLVVSQATTSVVVSSLASPATVGLPVTLKALVSGNGAMPTGTITFFDGTTSIGVSQVDSNGQATFVISSLTVGSHSITGVYSGDTNDAASTSSAFAQIIDKTTTTTTLTSTSASVPQGTSVQFAAQVSSNAGIPGGTIEFFDGATLLGTSTVNAAGVATFGVSNLLVGQHNIIAVYSGDANNGASTSTGLTQIIQPITMVALTSDHNPSSTGALLTFTAGVSGSNTIPTGTVTFKDGSSIIGVSTLNGAGVATLATTVLSAGSHAITASYAGDGNNTASVSAVYTQVIQQATTQTVLTVSTTTANYGVSVPMYATVTGTGGTPGGEVNFLDGGTVLGTSHLNAAGVASFSISNLTLGQHTLTAAYNGDTNDAMSTSAPQVLTIQKNTVSVSIASNNNPSLGGDIIAFTAVVSSNQSTPTGSVIWTDGSNQIGSTPLGGNGAASISISTLSVGTHTIVASYSGDSTNASASSVPLIQAVDQATSAVVLNTSKNPALLGDAINFAMVVTGTGGKLTGTVTLSEGGSAVGTVSIDANGLASFATSSLTVGTHTLSAVYGGDAYHAGSQSPVVEQVILRGTSNTVVSNKNPSIGGEAVTFTATLIGSGTMPFTGNVVFRDGGTLLATIPVSSTGVATLTTSSLSPGEHSITATYSGDQLNQSSSSAALVQTVQTSATTTTLSSALSAASLGSSVTLSAQVTGLGPTATGTVNFMDGATQIGSSTLTAAGIAVFTTSSLSAGQHILIAIYQGDANHLSSTSNPLVQSVLQPTTTAVSSTTNPSIAAENVVFRVSVSNTAGSFIPTGTVRLMDGSTSVSTSALDASGSAVFTLPALSVGQHSITAIYDGDSQNFTSTSPILGQNVTLHSITNRLLISSSSVVQGQQVTLTATLSGAGSVPPSGQIIFTSGTTTLGAATVNGSGVASLTITPQLGTYSVVAQYQGNSIYSQATSSPVAMSVVEATNFVITINPASLSLVSKQHATIQITVKSIQGFADTLALGCVGLPTAATCTFSTNQITLAANGAQTLDLVVDTGSPLTAGGVKTSSVNWSSNVTLCLLPAGILFGVGVSRRRRATKLLSGLLVLLAFVLTMGVSGCGTLDVHGTPAGNYIVNVTAIGNKSNVTQSAPMTLTVK